VPPRRKAKEAPGLLAKPASEGVAERPRLNGDHPPVLVADAPAAESPEAAPQADAPASASEEPALVEDGPVHRQLIRATLPRIEGEVKERPIPEFTMRMVRTSGRHRNAGGRPGGKGGGRAARQAAAAFRPGVMSSWSPSNPRPRGGDPQHVGRSPQQRPPGNKKSR
jgi:hypothetical protein